MSEKQKKAMRLPLYFLFYVVLFNGATHGPKGSAPVFVALMVALLVAIGVDYVRTGKQEVQAAKRQQLRARTEELEKELGLEPMNLHELDEVLAEDQKLRKEKEKE